MADIIEIRVPDIGDFDEVNVVEVLVSPGDQIEVEDGIVTLESDKSSMEVPSTHAGTVETVKVSVGDSIAQNQILVTLEVEEGSADADDGKEADQDAEEPEKDGSAGQYRQDSEPEDETKAAAITNDATAAAGEPSRGGGTPRSIDEPVDEKAFKKVHAGPAVRRLARELGVDLSKVYGTGRTGRILRQDIEAYVKKVLSGETATPGGGAFALPEMPEIDFSKFGEVEEKKLSRIRKLSAKNLHRSWLHVPHVTQHDEVDITEMETFRKAHADEAKARGVKLTPVAFMLKAVAAALKAFPDMNSSLSPDGESLILKKYIHIGVAVDTKDGLVVPVVRDVDQKGLFELAEELGETSARARDGKLAPKDFQGGSFTISSLGGIGGSFFTPIVNAPEVAILGVSRAQTKPIYADGEFVPRLMLPLSLSYDHRVIDGAAAARFIVHLGSLLADLRRLLL